MSEKIAFTSIKHRAEDGEEYGAEEIPNPSVFGSTRHLESGNTHFMIRSDPFGTITNIRWLPISRYHALYHDADLMNQEITKYKELYAIQRRIREKLKKLDIVPSVIPKSSVEHKINVLEKIEKELDKDAIMFDPNNEVALFLTAFHTDLLDDDDSFIKDTFRGFHVSLRPGKFGLLLAKRK